MYHLNFQVKGNIIPGEDIVNVFMLAVKNISDQFSLLTPILREFCQYFTYFLEHRYKLIFVHQLYFKYHANLGNVPVSLP